jgi:dTDP-3-amino-3,4,6-trideoxy-alpha-D-glucose transaminase
MTPFCDVAKLNAEVAPQLASAFERVSRGNSLILGPELQAFEEEWAEYCRTSFAVGVASGMDALTLMLRAFDVGAGDEVIVAGNGFVGTWMAVSNVGALPVGVAPSAATRNMMPSAAEYAVTARTKAILATHLYGARCDVEGLRSIADRYGIPLLFDACQAHGLRGVNLGDAAAFSFYPTKNLGALGDGGAVVTNESSVAYAVLCLRNYGSASKDVHPRVGYNSRLDELQAAFLRVKLGRLGEWNDRRRANAAVYLERLASCDVVLPVASDAHVWHIFSPLFGDRASMKAILAIRGIGSAVHYPAAPQQQLAYRAHAPCQVSDRLASTCLSLPIGPEHSEADVRKVADAVASVAAGLGALA